MPSQKDVRTNSKVPLVYILGFGHSGSTMLDLALGAMPNTESIGEIIRLRKEIDWNHPCTCGISLLDCPYWTHVLSLYEAKLEANGIDEGSDDPMEFTKILRKGEHQEYFKGVFNGSNISAPQAIVEDYGLRSYLLLQSVQEVSGSKVIVDSSKNHRRLILMWLSGLFDIKVVYLYRDSPELINSLYRRMKSLFKEIMKHNKDHELGQEYVKSLESKLNKDAGLKDVSKYIISISLSFKNKIRSIEYLKRFGLDAASVHFVNYRDIVEDPQSSISAICKHVGIEFDNDVIDFDSDHYFLKKMGHNMGGNFMRKKGPKPLVYRPVKDLSTRDKILNTLLGGKKADSSFNRIKNQHNELKK